jgi:hypothetical protein
MASIIKKIFNNAIKNDNMYGSAISDDLFNSECELSKKIFIYKNEKNI